MRRRTNWWVTRNGPRLAVRARMLISRGRFLPAVDLPLPFALDFYPLEAPEFTRIHPFFENLRKGKLTTTSCTKCGVVHWQPRVVCPSCNADALEWVDLPQEGELFAFTEVRAGAPIGFEKEVPFVTSLVRLKETKVLLTARIDGAKYEDLKIGDRVRLKVIDLPDGRVWFRFSPGKP